MFCAHGLVFSGTEGVRSHFLVLRARTHFRRYRGRRVSFSCFARPRVIFGGTEGVGSRFHVLRARTNFRRYRGREAPFSCFARPHSFSLVPRASGTVFMFCVPGHVFGGTEGVGSCFHFLHAPTSFRRYRGGWVPLSYFVPPDSF
jgi:hypothetical protein